MFALLADEDFDGKVLSAIRGVALQYQMPIQVVRVVDIDALGMGSWDTTILHFAAHGNWVVITHDRETMPDLADGRMTEGLPMAGLSSSVSSR